MSPLARVTGLALGSFALVVASGCGEDTRAIPFDTSGVRTPSSGFSGGTSTVTSTYVACPDEMARDGTSCSQSGLVCEYGGNVDTRCNPFVECDGSRWWRRPAPTCADACPDARSLVVEGAPCTPPDGEELLCAYARELCGCTETATGAFAWRCLPADAGCPTERPRIGSPCTDPVVCDYGACAFQNGLALECKVSSSAYGTRSGVWLVREATCSGSSPQESP